MLVGIPAKKRRACSCAPKGNVNSHLKTGALLALRCAERVISISTQFECTGMHATASAAPRIVGGWTTAIVMRFNNLANLS